MAGERGNSKYDHDSIAFHIAIMVLWSNGGLSRVCKELLRRQENTATRKVLQGMLILLVYYMFWFKLLDVWYKKAKGAAFWWDNKIDYVSIYVL